MFSKELWCSAVGSTGRSATATAHSISVAYGDRQPDWCRTRILLSESKLMTLCCVIFWLRYSEVSHFESFWHVWFNKACRVIFGNAACMPMYAMQKRWGTLCPSYPLGSFDDLIWPAQTSEACSNAVGRTVACQPSERELTRFAEVL